MPRRKFNDTKKIDPEVTKAPTIDLNVIEIKGRGQRWKLSYPDEANIATRHPVYKNGEVISYVESWVATNEMHEIHDTFTSEKAAREAAEFIKPGCEIKVIRTGKSTDNLAKAREAKRKKREEQDDD